ncbi:hypothetical protein HN51_053622 [Arachis hypogaea]|uniref:Isocitrate dehydrogenase [NAD] catalytic subunit 5 n=2 Tax=Arachis hypogaea TaxID=3818 RepID=A0A6B9V3L3_ARAHY|nr:Isocitrate dehydrogenase [NAD] catalytic subunit 5 [Arachis hypogaea]
MIRYSKQLMCPESGKCTMYVGTEIDPRTQSSTPSCNIGEGGIALAESIHGSAPDIAGKNLANPTALLMIGVSMLRHLNIQNKADHIQNAILNTIAEGRYRTVDLGGKAKTTEFTNAIIDHL